MTYNPQRYIDYIRTAIAKIQAYTQSGEKAFMTDSKTQEAVLFNFETLCDATAQLPENWRAEHPEVNWQVVKDFRNRLAHQYFNIRLDLVWNAVESGILDEILAAVVAMERKHLRQNG
ncbi:MAG: DUF86 domain-containing protein [Synechococcales cyanobacterium RM1_1_8]|nr:DUF86 domain-containing protein [Synechococcales cyanobacterium RM1_1_8]